MFIEEDEILSMRAMESYFNLSDIVGEDDLYEEFYGDATEGIGDVFKTIGRAILIALDWLKKQLMNLFGKGDALLHKEAFKGIKAIKVLTVEVYGRAQTYIFTKWKGSYTPNSICDYADDANEEIKKIYRETILKISRSRKSAAYDNFPECKKLVDLCDKLKNTVEGWLEFIHDEDRSILMHIKPVTYTACMVINQLVQAGLYSNIYKPIATVSEDQISGITIT